MSYEICSLLCCDLCCCGYVFSSLIAFCQFWGSRDRFTVDYQDCFAGTNKRYEGYRSVSNRNNIATHESSAQIALQWRHNGRDGVSNHQPHHCSLNRLFRCRSKKTSKLRLIDLCAGNSPVTGEFPAQMTSNAENLSIWWRHHGVVWCRS